MPWTVEYHENMFLKHEPCPKCRSRDNLGRYADGSAWCFGCGYYVPAKRTLQNARPQQEEGKDVHSSIDLDLSDSIPSPALTWLRKYGITNEEIDRYGILYDRTSGGIILGTQIRIGGFDGVSKKRCITFRRQGLSDWECTGTGPIGIFVEDFVSAIKVGRSWAGVPIYGSNIPLERLKWASERFQQVGVWLDSDKASEALKIVSRAKLLYGDGKFFRIYSDLDPKYYSTQEIDSYVKDSIRSSGTSLQGAEHD